MIVVGAGALLTVFLYSFVKGSVGEMVSTTARFESGHVKVTTHEYTKYADQLPNDLALTEVGGLLENLREQRPEMLWLPRIRFGGLVDVPDAQGETQEQAGVYGMGVRLLDAESEKRVLSLNQALVDGRMPQSPKEVLLAQPFASALEVDIGDTVTLISSGAYGGLVVHDFTVAGMLRFGVSRLDERLMIADLAGVRQALNLDDGASEIVGFNSNLQYKSGPAQALREWFNKRYHKPDQPFSPFMRTLTNQGQMAGMVKLANSIGGILIGVFVFAMSIVLWNAGLMNGIRRYGEIGVRLAIGESKGSLYRSMIAEAVLIGLIGSAVGTLAGVGLSYWFEMYGLDIGAQMKDASVLMASVVRAEVTPTSFYIGFLPGVFASVLGTVFAGIGIYKRQTSELFKELEA